MLDQSDHLKKQLQSDQVLLSAIQADLPQLESLLMPFQALYEDGVYRFYHHSFKVYQLQEYTSLAVEVFKRIAVATDNKLSERFEQIIAAGTGSVWEPNHNHNWTLHTRPIVEAFLHAKYFLDMMIKYGRAMDTSQNILPTGWAAILELYNQR
jgi:hypothetical protein